ncbi:MAG: hypothetical protein GX562_07710 [Coriobacteriaceae bacterium]|nr:hypothetical protein [Coriobacteriaceae bacterium]
MKDYTQVERDNAALTIREYAFGQMNILRILGDEDAENNLQEAINMAIAALRGPQPDPDTGLARCGCGGKAKIWPSDPTQFTHVITDYEVGCTECAMTTGWVRGKQENAMKVWNTAMGWKGGSK